MSDESEKPPQTLADEGDAQAYREEQWRLWTERKVNGAPRKQLENVADWLRFNHNDDDLHHILQSLKKFTQQPRKRERKRKRNLENFNWWSPEGLQAKREIKALWAMRNLYDPPLSQVKACEMWQEQARKIPSRAEWPCVHLDAESVKRAVFGR